LGIFDIFLLEAVINGLLLGGVLALLSLGLNLVFGVIDVVWICYAELIMLGMYAMYFLYTIYHAPIVLAAAVCIVGVGLLGLVLHTLVIAPLLGAAPINQLLATGGVLFFLQSAATVLFGIEFKNLGLRLPVLKVAGMFVSFSRLLAFAAALIGMVLVYLLLTRTYTGPAIVTRSLPWIGGAALVALPFVYRSPYPLHILIIILIWSFAYTSWSVMGRFGLVSLGHGGFMGIGAYVTALAWNYGHVSPWIGIPLALLAGAGLAALVAYPCFRFRITGHYFALVTLALSGIVLQVITATRDHTGGSLGYTPERYHGGNSLWALQFSDKTTWYLIALAVWAAGLFIWNRVDRSMLRYALEAISEDEDAAAATGVHVTAEKLKITVLSATMTALAGALYCPYQMFISPDTVSGISVSLQMVFAVVVG